MNKLLSAIIGLMLCASVAYPATGDIVSVSVDSNGWVASITVEGLAVGGTYDFGLGTNNNPSTAKIIFTVVSLGYDDTGSPTTITRTIYGTKQLRKVYPDHEDNDETVDGSNVIIRVALSDYIYTKDNTGEGNSGTAPTVSIASGWYTQAETPTNAATGMSVTNTSTAVYQPVVGNWTWPAMERITGTTLTLRAVAYHDSAQQGRPVRAIKFTCADESANSTSATLTEMTVDPTFGDASVVTEYVATMDMTDLTQGDTITCNFIAYPWMGDGESILDTGDGTYSQPTPYYAPQHYILDKTGGYGVGVCVVDATTGNDSTGACVAESAFNPSSPPNAFATINKAADVLQDFNNANYSRNTVEGTIYLNAGTHAWSGASNTISTATIPKTWVTIRPFPGLTKSDVTIAGVSGDKRIGGVTKVKFDDVTINGMEGQTSVFHTFAMLWLHNVDIAAPVSTVTIYAVPLTMITQSVIGNCTLILAGFGSDSKVNLTRGNVLNGYSGNVWPYVFIGNLKTDTGWEMTLQHSATAPVNTIGVIVAYNQLYGAGAGNVLRFYTTETLDTAQRGLAIIQNVFERQALNLTLVVGIAHDGTTQEPVNNVMMWHNTTVGERWNVAYNDTGDASALRKYWSAYNNITESIAIKADTFGTANGARIGNWSYLYGVGQVGNIDSNTGLGQFKREFEGLYSTIPINKRSQPVASDANDRLWINYFLYAANDRSSAGAGNGIYQLNANSPVAQISRRVVIPYDIRGVRRRAEADDPGAFVRGVGKVL